MRLKKPKTKRSQVKYSSMDGTYNLKTRFELYDQDYINGYKDSETGGEIRALSEKEKDWLNRFNSEYINADFRQKRVSRKIKREHPKNANLKKLNKILNQYLKEMTEKINGSDITVKSSANLRRTISKFREQLKKKIQKEMKFVKDYYRKQAEDNNNARNRCVLTRARAQGKTLGIDELPADHTDDNDVENNLIESLDFAKNLKNGIGNS